MSPAALSTLVLLVVVDQIDGGVAAVECHGTEIAYLPLEVLPADVAEGDRLEIRVRRRPARPPTEPDTSRARARRDRRSADRPHRRSRID